MSSTSGRTLTAQSRRSSSKRTATNNGRFATQAEQSDAEAAIVSNFSICNIRGKKERVNPNKLDLNRLKTVLHDQYYNIELLKAVSCAFDFVIHTADIPSVNNDGLPHVSQAIQDHVTKLRRIGAESVEGVVLLGGLNNEDDLFVIKAPRDPQYDGLLHEYFVGIVALNQLRMNIPNFMYTFAGFKCGAPRIRGKQVMEWCSSESKVVNYVAYEKITGVALNDAMKDITLGNFISYYIQIILSTLMAAEKYSYTHYDLHDGNVLLREVDQDTMFWIPYHFSGGETYYVYTDRIATIIDYGRVHIKYKGKHYGYWGMESDGLFHDKARPLHDLFKVLGFSCYSALEAKRNDLLRDLAPLYKFFRNKTNSNNFTNILKRERDTYFELSSTITEKELETSPRDLLEYIRTNYDTIFNDIVAPSLEKNSPIITCEGVKTDDIDSCPTVNELLRSLTPKVISKSKSRTPKRTLSHVVTDIRNIASRYGDLKLCKDELDCDIEATALESKLQTLSEEFDNEFDSMRKEMTRRLTKGKKLLEKSLKEIDFDIPIQKPTNNPDRNEKILFSLSSEISSYLAVLDRIKAFAQDLALLNRAEEQAGVDPTPPTIYRLPYEAANAAASINNSLRNYLESFTDDLLNFNGIELKNILLAKL